MAGIEPASKKETPAVYTHSQFCYYKRDKEVTKATLGDLQYFGFLKEDQPKKPYTSKITSHSASEASTEETRLHKWQS
jgi:competence protein ComGC